MRRGLATALLLSIAPLPLASVEAVPIPAHFDSVGDDRRAIETLLATYTRAVSTKDQALFETLLLNKDIPFSGVGAAGPRSSAPGATSQYGAFRAGVFRGPAFTQRFEDIHIDQDGPLASVSLVFVNTASDGTSWGWKTMQLLKAAGQWKIASEFYTGHAG